MKEHLSLDVCPSPWLILLFDSQTVADIISFLQMCCLYCIYGPIVSVSSSEQNAFVMHSSNLFCWLGTISIIVPVEKTGAMAPQGKHEEQPAATGCLLWGHHKKRIVTWMRVYNAVGNVLHETSNHCMSVACVQLQYVIWIVVKCDYPS